MRFVDDNDVVLDVDAGGFTGCLLQEEIVGKRYDLGGGNGSTRRKVGTGLEFLPETNEVFDILWTCLEGSVKANSGSRERGLTRMWSRKSSMRDTSSAGGRCGHRLPLSPVM